jgi:hypothetical protein
MNKEQLCERLKYISDCMAKLESELPYDYEQHCPDMQFLANVRQYIYTSRRTFGSIRETVKDERNWQHDN